MKYSYFQPKTLYHLCRKPKAHLYFQNSCFCCPSGVGAQLEKGALPPFDPPDLVLRLAWPNPELALLAQPFYLRQGTSMQVKG